jgi:hypothetical protein
MEKELKREFDINAGEVAIVNLHCSDGTNKAYELVTSSKKNSAQLEGMSKTKDNKTT